MYKSGWTINLMGGPTCLLRLNKRLTAGHGAMRCTERSLYLFIVHFVDFSSFWFLL